MRRSPKTRADIPAFAFHKWVNTKPDADGVGDPAVVVGVERNVSIVARLQEGVALDADDSCRMELGKELPHVLGAFRLHLRRGGAFRPGRCILGIFGGVDERTISARLGVCGAKAGDVDVVGVRVPVQEAGGGKRKHCGGFPTST